MRHVEIGMCLAALLLCPVAAHPEDTPPEAYPVTLIDSTCAEGRIRNLMLSVSSIIPGAASSACLTTDSAEGRKLLAEIPHRLLPAIVFDPAIERHPNFKTLADQQFVRRIGKRYVGRERAFNLVPGFFLPDRERIPNRLDVFVMAFCPASQLVQRIVLNYRQAVPNAGLDIRLRFITSETEGRLMSFHGNEEVWEDANQALIQRDHNDRLRDYLLARQDLTAPQSMAVAGLLTEELVGKQPEAMEILRQDAEAAALLGIANAPVLLWENQYLLYNIQGLRWYAPFERLSLLQPVAGGCGPEWKNMGSATAAGVSQEPVGGCASGCKSINSGVPIAKP